MIHILISVDISILNTTTILPTQGERPCDPAMVEAAKRTVSHDTAEELVTTDVDGNADCFSGLMVVQ